MTSCIRSFLGKAESFAECCVLTQKIAVSFDEGPQSFLRHVGDEVIAATPAGRGSEPGV